MLFDETNIFSFFYVPRWLRGVPRQREKPIPFFKLLPSIPFLPVFTMGTQRFGRCWNMGIPALELTILNGSFELKTPRDRSGTFEPQFIRKH